MEKGICVKEVIVSNLTRRGAGTRMSPVRVITQVFEKDGTLIAEKDSFNDDFTQMDLVHFAQWCIRKKKTAPVFNDVEKWLDEIEEKNPDPKTGANERLG